MSIDMKAFEQDEQGRTYQDVLSRPIDRAALQAALDIMSPPDAVRRMKEAEVVHDRPALAGVVREIEAHPDFAKAFARQRTTETNRLKMAVGCAAKVVMQRAGWRKARRKSSLKALAKWFRSAERYEAAE